MSFQSNDPKSALTRYAQTKDPSKLPRDVCLTYDDWTIVIFDAYEKAKFHFLVLPRIPFPLSDSVQSEHKQQNSQPGGTDYATVKGLGSPATDGCGAGSALSDDRASKKPKLALAGDKLAFGTTGCKTVPTRHLQDINTLLASPYASQVFGRLKAMAERVKSIILSEMPRATLDAIPFKGHTHATASVEQCLVTWPVHLGFHAIPSMSTVHLHCISCDLVSERLKRKHHYLSFKHDHGFFLHTRDIEQWIREGRKAQPKSTAELHKLLKADLVSIWDANLYKDMPSLKRHLETEWKADIQRRQQSERNEHQQGQSTKMISTAEVIRLC
ncbi:hypothetical protein K437DRAFT_256810 [Tilletiaria anomala UBC 951]|uniref:Aprataxin C2HE/C2H2/C2HC zinc finger domain-containing protein n=1 Tax=Tilletiaria anomala (strain ATCC 24038 / CBS 436.72 / UBC 951) TaxID=1037660 RepID=A0A066W2E1_TILAU|nr:uncharacterized protein K437DRAFT_256810 [Tilletiaria anomala UBC 951]KDN44945.1 hypothetical protein K437DRAFT_256810 [Tilletiaria anomala UBC 951]